MQKKFIFTALLLVTIVGCGYLQINQSPQAAVSLPATPTNSDFENFSNSGSDLGNEQISNQENQQLGSNFEAHKNETVNNSEAIKSDETVAEEDIIYANQSTEDITLENVHLVETDDPMIVSILTSDLQEQIPSDVWNGDYEQILKDFTGEDYEN